ncbi:putative DNA binding domain-containing protein [bacterium]|nr:putative DNA binding domain-containing protein [bacterium]
MLNISIPPKNTEESVFLPIRFSKEELAITAVAMGNRNGGYIVIGDLDEGLKHGNNLLISLEEQVKESLKTLITPELQYEIRYKTFNNQPLLVIEISPLKKGTPYHYYIQTDLYGFYHIRYVRVHDENLPATLSMLEESSDFDDLSGEIECRRYKDSSKRVLLDRFDGEFPISRKTVEMIGFIKKNIRFGSDWEYPLDVLEEIINNSIIHSNPENSKIVLYIFDSHIEIQNSADLQLTVEQIKDGFFYFGNKKTHSWFKTNKKANMKGDSIIKIVDRFKTSKSFNFSILYNENSKIFTVKIEHRNQQDDDIIQQVKNTSTSSEMQYQDTPISGINSSSKQAEYSGNADTFSTNKNQQVSISVLDENDLLIHTNKQVVLENTTSSFTQTNKKNLENAISSTSSAQQLQVDNNTAQNQQVEIDDLPYSELVKTDKKQQVFLKYLSEPRTSKEIMLYLGVKDRGTFYKKYLTPAIEAGFVLLEIPDKPQSPKQRYYSNF